MYVCDGGAYYRSQRLPRHALRLSMFSEFLSRIRGLLFSPGTEFDRIAAEPTSVVGLVRRFLVPLALLTPIATIVGMNSFDVAWNVDHGYRIPKERILNTGVANFAFEIITVMMAGRSQLVIMRRRMLGVLRHEWRSEEQGPL